jgi:hypothetical protein
MNTVSLGNFNIGISFVRVHGKLRTTQVDIGTEVSFVDPHWFQGGSGSSFLSKGGSGSRPDPGSQRNADPCSPDPGQPKNS